MPTSPTPDSVAVQVAVLGTRLAAAERNVERLETAIEELERQIRELRQNAGRVGGASGAGG